MNPEDNPGYDYFMFGLAVGVFIGSLLASSWPEV